MKLCAYIQRTTTIMMSSSLLLSSSSSSSSYSSKISMMAFSFLKQQQQKQQQQRGRPPNLQSIVLLSTFSKNTKTLINVPATRIFHPNTNRQPPPFAFAFSSTRIHYYYCLQPYQQQQQQQQQQQRTQSSFARSSRSTATTTSTTEKRRPKLYRRLKTKLFVKSSDKFKMRTEDIGNGYGGDDNNDEHDHDHDTNYKDTKYVTRYETLYRADRVLSNRSGKSRSECFQLIKEKRVQYLCPTEDDDDDNNDNNMNNMNNNNTRDINSTNKGHWKIITGPSMKLSMNVPIRIDKTIIVPEPIPLLCVYNKPKWVLSVVNDPIYNRPCVVPPYGMHPVGRLDYDSSGLLLYSSSGVLTQAILHPKNNIEKTYKATVSGTVDQETLQKQLTNGVITSEGIHTATLVSVTSIDNKEFVRDYINTIITNLPKQYNQTDLQQRGYFDIYDTTITNGTISNITLTVSEGKHRMVRRMLANCGYPVLDLHRIQIGPVITIDHNNNNNNNNSVPPGTIRAVSAIELKWAQSLASMKSSTTSSTRTSTTTKTTTTATKNENNHSPPPTTKTIATVISSIINDSNSNSVKNKTNQTQSTRTAATAKDSSTKKKTTTKMNKKKNRQEQKSQEDTGTTSTNSNTVVENKDIDTTNVSSRYIV